MPLGPDLQPPERRSLPDYDVRPLLRHRREPQTPPAATSDPTAALTRAWQEVQGASVDLRDARRGGEKLFRAFFLRALRFNRENLVLPNLVRFLLRLHFQTLFSSAQVEVAEPGRVSGIKAVSSSCSPLWFLGPPTTVSHTSRDGNRLLWQEKNAPFFHILNGKGGRRSCLKPVNREQLWSREIPCRSFFWGGHYLKGTKTTFAA